MNTLRKELRPDFAPAEKLYPLPKKSLIKDKKKANITSLLQKR